MAGLEGHRTGLALVVSFGVLGYDVLPHDDRFTVQYQAYGTLVADDARVVQTLDADMLEKFAVIGCRPTALGTHVRLNVEMDALVRRQTALGSASHLTF